MLTLSIVIPAYNERRRLPEFVREVRAYCDQVLAGAYEVLVVDDGSCDGTWEWLQTEAENWPALTPIRHERNRGKGAAIRTGVSAAAAQYVLFSDADGATPIAEERALRNALVAGTDLAIGIRKPGDRRVSRDVFRRVQACAFRALVRTIVGLDMQDTQCGFKMLTQQAARVLFPILQEPGFLLDIELLLSARDRKLGVREHAVQWSEKAGSKVRLARDAWRMFIGLWRLRARFLRKGVARAASAIGCSGYSLGTEATLPQHAGKPVL